MARKSITKSKSTSKPKVKKYQFAGSYNTSTYNNVANPYYIDGTYAEQAGMQADRLYGQAQQFGAYAAESNRQAAEDIKKRQEEDKKFLEQAKAEGKAAKQQEFLETARSSYQTIGDLAKDIGKKRAADKLAKEADKSKAANIALKVGQEYGVLPTTPAPSITGSVVPPPSISGAPMPVEVGSQVVSTTPTWGEVANTGVELSKDLTKADPGIGAGTTPVGGPQYANAGTTAAGAGILLNLTGAGVKYSGDDNDPTTFTDKEANRYRLGTTLQTTGQGMQLGSQIGGYIVPGLGNLAGGAIGAGLGAGYGWFFKGKKGVEEARQIAEDYQTEKARIDKETSAAEATRKALLAKQNAQLAQQYNTAFLNSRLTGMQTGFGYNTSTNMNMQPTSSFYAKTGGKLPGGHVVPMGAEKLKGGYAIPIGPNGERKFIGNKHSESKIDGVSGIRLNKETKDPKEVITEVERGETEDTIIKADGTPTKYFYSAYLKLGGKSFAKRHEELVKAGASQKEIQDLAKKQEAVANKKGEKDRGPEQIAKYGGIHKYKMAGPEESAMAQSNMDAANVTLRDANKAAAKAPSDQQSVAPGKRTNFSGMIKEYAEGGPKEGNISLEEWNSMSDDEQYRLIYDLAKKAGDKFPEVTAAQWAKESGWGKQMTGSWNMFGQTTKGKDGTVLTTSKDPGGGSKKFANYKTLEDSVAARVKKWSPKYKDAKNPEEALMMLQNYGGQGRYAQGFPTKEFPEGDWKSYVTGTMKIINQQAPKLKSTDSDWKLVSEPGYLGSTRTYYYNKKTGEIRNNPVSDAGQQAAFEAKQSQDANVRNIGLGVGMAVPAGLRALGMNILRQAGNEMLPTPNTGVAKPGPLPGLGGGPVPKPNTGVTPYTGPGTAVGPFTGNIAKPGQAYDAVPVSEVGPYLGKTRPPITIDIPPLGSPKGGFPIMAPIKEAVGKIKPDLSDSAKAQKAAELPPLESRPNLGDIPAMQYRAAELLPATDKGLAKATETIKDINAKKDTAETKTTKGTDAASDETVTPPRDKSVNGALLVGAAQLLPLLYPALKPYKPEGKLERMASVGNVGATSIKGSTMPRVSMNFEKYAAEATNVAIKNAIQNTNAGPGAITAMMAANTAKAGQLNAIANQEQNANKQLAAEEARLGQQASMANAEMAQRANMANVQNQLAVNQANLEASMQEAKMRMLEKQYKREEIMGALDTAVTRAANVYADDRRYKAQERLANAMDDAGSYQRFQYYEDLKKQAKDPESEFYNKTDQELKDYATKQYNQFIGTTKTGTAKTGGARRYTTRLGELSKGRKTFKI